MTHSRTLKNSVTLDKVKTTTTASPDLVLLCSLHIAQTVIMDSTKMSASLCRNKIQIKWAFRQDQGNRQNWRSFNSFQWGSCVSAPAGVAGKKHTGVRES